MMPLGVTSEQLLLTGSQVCSGTVRCDPCALCWAIESCGGPTVGKPSTPEPLGVGNHMEMQGKADNSTGQHQGSVWCSLMWAVCSWCLCSRICVVSRCYLTHPLLISSELLILHKHCANPPWEHNRSVSPLLKNSRMCERKTVRAPGDV